MDFGESSQHDSAVISEEEVRATPAEAGTTGRHDTAAPERPAPAEPSSRQAEIDQALPVPAEVIVRHAIADAGGSRCTEEPSSVRADVITESDVSIGVPELRAPGPRVPEPRVPEQRVSEQRVSEQRVPEQRVPEQRVSEQPAPVEPPVPSFHGLVGEHPSILSIIEVIRRVAATDATVLITGESGTGKELVAEAIHRMSTRARSRFVPVHCGAIPEDLLESEMFGHEKGAFTGAIANRTGRFKLADSGTIFLDEIGEMSPKLQVKLLRVLEDGRVEPVGSVSTQQVNVRVVAATNRNLQDPVTARAFREDLYYRLRVVPIEMPALRRRKEDIPLLVRHFLQTLHTQKGLRHCTVDDDAMDALMEYRWPGNVRELKNALEQMLVLGTGGSVLGTADLPAHLMASQPIEAGPPATAPWEFGPRGIDFYREMEVIEDRIIAQALRLSAGNKKEAARLLRVNRTTLLEKLKRKRQQEDGLLARLLIENDGWRSVAPSRREAPLSSSVEPGTVAVP
jgi:DNA-binding NtrC family response regulator